MKEWLHFQQMMQDMDQRLEEMDRHGIDMHVLSLSSPGVHRMEDGARRRRPHRQIERRGGGTGGAAPRPSRLVLLARDARPG